MAIEPNTIFSIKRLIGKKFDDLKKEFINSLPYKVVRGSNGGPMVDINGKTYSPQEISAIVLQKMKKTAEEFLGCEVKKAVITVPAYFNDAERTATKEAGEIAGLEVMRIINEPTAAALSYGTDKNGDKTIVVFDLGGGTFDISILEIGDGVFEVKSTNGDVWLGGDLFDEEIIKWLVKEFKKDINYDLKTQPQALQRLREAAEKAKIELSSSSQAEINLPYIASVDNIPQHLVKTLTRAKFEQLIDVHLKKINGPCEKVLSDSGIKISDIDEILLVGGSTRIPIVQDIVKKIFGKEPNKSVNPDESVAVGAAIQGGVLSGQITDILLLDVTPLSMGIETMGNVMTRLIESNTTIPVSKTETFTTAADNQSSVEIHILQGERILAKDNKTLGRFHLDNIPPAPRGIPQISVTIDIDSNGIVKVSAKDKGTGKEQSIRIEGSSSLSKDEIEKMRNEAKIHEDEDRKEKEQIEKLNVADSLIFQTEKQIKEFGDKISESQKNELNSLKDKLKSAHSDKNLNDVEQFINELNTKWHEISQQMYNAGNQTQDQSQDQPKQDQRSNQSNNDTTQDVDYEEVK